MRHRYATADKSTACCRACGNYPGDPHERCRSASTDPVADREVFVEKDRGAPSRMLKKVPDSSAVARFL